VNLDLASRARLVGVFVEELDETVASLRALAPALGADAGALDDFGRLAHGLKGAAGALGYEGLARAFHLLEDLALGVPSQAAGAAGAHLRRVAEAVEILAEGAARMAASGTDGFPDDLATRLLDAVVPGARAPDAATAPAPATDEPVPSGGARAGEGMERLSVPATEVDQALRLASSLARGAAQLHEALERAGGALAPAAHSLATSAGSLEAIVAALRLLPAESALSGIEEEVAALAARLGKRAEVRVSGRDVRADRRTLQTARGMIRHLVRNALDHGIEGAEARLRAGKPEAGQLAIALGAGESTLRVAVSDDGGGFDGGAIRRELARRGGDPARIASLSDDEVLQVWALEGGSTRAQTTEVSGRGLGLSAVARLARAAGGELRVRSVRGEGSTVEFSLPLDVYAVEALAVYVGGRPFGIPLAAVERTVHAAAAGGAIQDGPTGRTLAVGETILPLGALAEVVGVPGSAGSRFVYGVARAGAMAAFAADEVGAVEGMVPATVPGIAQSDALVTGIARLGDGTAVPVLNPRLLLARARAALAAPRPARGEAERRSAPAPRRLEVVLAEDSLATREVLRLLLEEQGFRVRVAADGEEALERVRERAPDVLVSDVNMPRRDGLSLTRALRGHPATQRLPIVLLTSQDDDAARAAGAAAGADAYLVKAGFNASVLAETLARIGVGANASERSANAAATLRPTSSGAA
jgi:two-component system chemotaxis sensor kinase CheA